MAVKSGGEVFMSIGGTRVNGKVDGSFEIAIKIFETTTKDSGGYKEKLSDTKGATGTINCNLNNKASNGYAACWDAMIAKVAVAFTYGRGISVVGGELISGNLIITSVDRTDDAGSPSAFSLSYRITGKPTYGTSAATLAAASTTA